MLSDFHPFEVALTLAGNYFPNARKIDKPHGHVVFHLGCWTITLAPSGQGVSFTLAKVGKISGMLVSNPVDNFETYTPKEAALWLSMTHNNIVSEVLDNSCTRQGVFPWYGEGSDALADVHTLWTCGMTLRRLLEAPDSEGRTIAQNLPWTQTLHRTGQTVVHMTITSRDGCYTAALAYNANSNPIKWSAKVDLPVCVTFPEERAKVSGEIPKSPDNEIGYKIIALALEPLWQRMVSMSKISTLNRHTSTL